MKLKESEKSLPTADVVAAAPLEFPVESCYNFRLFVYQKIMWK